MKHELPEHIREDLAKMLAIYYGAGETSHLEDNLGEWTKARRCAALNRWSKTPDAYRYAINQILAGEGQSIIP